MPGIEPGAFHMQSERSTAELHPLLDDTPSPPPRTPGSPPVQKRLIFSKETSLVQKIILHYF